jgi:hypothetical protein
MVPFTLTGSIPANGAINIPNKQPVTLTFSQPVDSSTVSSGITVSSNLGTLPPYATSVSGNNVVFNPNPMTGTGWPGSANISFTPNSNLKSTDGATWNATGVNPTFTTAPGFTLTGSMPANNATNVPEAQPVTLTFSNAVNSSTVSSGITVSTNSGTLPSYATSVSGNNVVIDPSPMMGTGWPLGADVSFNPNSNLLDIYGNLYLPAGPLANGIKFTTTQNATTFTFLKSIPANNGSLFYSNPIVFEYSLNVDPSTIWNGFTAQIYSGMQWWSNPLSCTQDPSNFKKVNCRNGLMGGSWESGHQYKIEQKTSLKSCPTVGGLPLSNPQTIYVNIYY